MLVTGIYAGQEYEILPSIRILIANILIYLRNLRDPIEQAAGHAQNQSIYERIVKIFWW